MSTDLPLEEIKKLPPEEAIPILDGYLEANPECEEAFILRGRKHWILNHHKEAINDYHSAISLNSESKAGMLLDYANSILDYYNKDLLNP